MPTYSGTTHFYTAGDLKTLAASGLSTGTSLADGDALIFTAERTNKNVIAGLDQSYPGIDLYSIDVAFDYPGDIGMNGSPLELVADTIVHRGSGGFWFKSNFTGGGTTDTIIVNSDNVVNAMSIDSDGNDSNISNIYLANGTISIASTCGDLAKFIVTQRANLATSFATIAASSFSITDADQGAGEVSCGRDVTRLNVANGLWRQTSGNVGFARVSSGGRLHYNTTEALTFAIVYPGGTLDFTKSDGRKTATVARMPGATVNYNESLHDITWARLNGDNPFG